MFDWSNTYSVGIGSVDSQHQNLFAIARELHAAMTAGQGKSALARILDRLVQYTAVHFAHEERLMRLHDYPDLAKHKAEHDALTKQVVKFQEDFNSGRAAMTVQLLQFLKDWLQTHIKGSDLKYAPHLKDRAVA
jgi:hemerythrin-like metal-binding protein